MLVRSSIYEHLEEFVKNGDSAGLKFFLRWEQDRRRYLNHRNNDGLTLLHQACLLGKPRVVHTLVECGCDIEGRSSVGWTALHAAALSGCFDVVSYLVNTCASDVSAIDDMGCKPIDLTLEPQVTNLLRESIDKADKKAAKDTEIFKESIKRHSTYNLRTLKGRSNTCPTKIASSLSPRVVTRVRSETYMSNRATFEKGKDDTHSLPGDLFAKKDKNNNETTKTKIEDSRRDSGIYDDFLEMRQISAKAHASKKVERPPINLQSRSTTV